MVNCNFDQTLLASLDLAVAKLSLLIRHDQGARIGHSTVASQKVHLYNADTPEEIHILQDADAGQVFYQRRQKGAIFHLDIFHECGLVNHRQVAAALKQAIDTYNYHRVLESMTFMPHTLSGVKADFVDIQTGTGWGRITGSLSYGAKLSLRRTHENHVHVAATLALDNLACLFYMVQAVEAVI